MMKAGQLRHRVTLQRRVVTTDTFGGLVESYHGFAMVWARIQPLRGVEFFAAQQTNAALDSKITIRYLAGVQPIDRVVCGGRVYDVQATINPEERNIELQLMCREVTTSD